MTHDIHIFFSILMGMTEVTGEGVRVFFSFRSYTALHVFSNMCMFQAHVSRLRSKNAITPMELCSLI